MSLKPCPECKNPVSTTASKCPKCGAPTVANAVASLGMLAFFIGAIVFLVLYLIFKQ